MEHPERLVRAVRGLLDFLYLAQYQVHSEDTLRQMKDALALFHDNKDIFVDLGLSTPFNLPKLHWAQHYVASIRRFGSPDNFNTEYTERLHIDFAKKAYRASNHKEVLPQMTTWMDRKEKVLRFAQHVKSKQDRLAGVVKVYKNPGLREGPHYKIANNPSQPKVKIERLVSDYHAPRFTAALKEFVVQNNQPHLAAEEITRIALIQSMIHVPHVAVYHKVRFSLGDQHEIPWTRNERDVIHVKPSQKNKHNQLIPGRFDPAIIDMGSGQHIGVDGAHLSLLTDLLADTCCRISCWSSTSCLHTSDRCIFSFVPW